MKIKNILASSPISENATGTSDQDYDVYNVGGRGGKPMNIDIGLGGTGRGVPPKASNFKSKTGVQAAPTSQAKPPVTPTRVEPTLTKPRIEVKPGETPAQATQRAQREIQAKGGPAGTQRTEPSTTGGPAQVWRKGDGTTPIGTPAAAKGQTITGKVGTRSPAPVAPPLNKSGLGLAGAAALATAGYKAFTGDNKPAVTTAKSPNEPADNASLPSKPYPKLPNPVVKPMPSKLAIAATPDAASLAREKIAAQSNLAQAPQGSSTTTAGEQPPGVTTKPAVAPTAPTSGNVDTTATAARDRIAKLAVPPGTSAPSQINPAVISKEPAASTAPTGINANQNPVAASMMRGRDFDSNAGNQPPEKGQVGTGTGGTLVSSDGTPVNSGGDIKRAPGGFILPEEELEEGDDALSHIKQLSNITKESKETHMSMDFKKIFGIMDAISMNEAKMADIKGQKYSGSYGAEYQGDSDDEDTGTTVSKAPAEKKGRGRPKGDVVATNPKDTAAKRASDKESKAYAKANPTKVTRHTLSDKPPKGSAEYKEKKSSLKDWIESSEAAINEAKAKNKYAIGMAVAKKAADDEPPLKKSTIVKAHEIAKKIKEDEENSFVCVHAKKGKCEVKAKSSYEAAKKAADKWKLKSTAGIDTHRADKPIHVDETTNMDEATELKGGQKKLDVAPPKGKLDAKDFAALRAKKTVKEGIHMEDSHDTLAHVTNRFKHEVKQFMANPDMDMDDDLYEALFDYYLDSGEIPYGVAKARTGDPHQWVYNRFQADMGSPQITSETAMLPEAFGSGETVYWRGKAGTVDRVEGDKCFVHTASGDMDVWPAGECSKEKQGAFSIFKKDVSDIGTGLGRFATGKSEIDEAELEESPFTYAAKMAKAAGKESFTLGDKQFDVKESKDMDTQLESWDRQLNSLLNESLTISTTQGDQGDDTISVTASGADAQEVMAIMRNAGLGGMGNKQEDSTKFSNYGVPVSGDQDHEGTALITVDDGQSGGDDMLSLMKKMSGIGSDESSDDYADEESNDEEFNDEESDNGEFTDEESNDEEESGSCSECGMSEGSCEHGQMVDEAEEQVEESYANSADDQADQDIDFMMNTISGGLNRRKRDQTTLPHTSVKVSESNDLMAEFLKLSGLK